MPPFDDLDTGEWSPAEIYRMARTKKMLRSSLLAAFASTLLAACGGGGGGGTTTPPTPDAGALPTAAGTPVPAPAPSASPSASGPAPAPAPAPAVVPAPAPAPAPGTTPTPTTPAPAAFSAFAPEVVAQSVSVPTPRVARLAGGGSVVLWAAGRQVWAQRTDAAGQFLGSAFAVGPANLEDIPDFSVAAAADGGFIVAWEIEDGPQVTQFGTVQALQVTRFGADGTVQNDVRVNDGHYNSFTGRPIVKATADGGFVVAWTAKSLLPAPSWGYLQRLASDGSRVGPLVTLGGAAPRLAQLTPIPLADGSVLAAWLQSDSTTSGGSTYSVYTQRFGTDSAPVADAVRVEAASGTASFPFDAAALSNGNVALAWIAHDAPGLYQVRSTLLTAAGTSAAAVETYDWPYTIWELPYVAVAPLADGFGVAWQALQSYNRGTIGEIWLQRHAGTGAASQAPTKVVGLSTADFSPTTGHVAYASPGFSLDGGADGHFISAFQSIPATAYLMGQ